MRPSDDDFDERSVLHCSCHGPSGAVALFRSVYHLPAEDQLRHTHCESIFCSHLKILHLWLAHYLIWKENVRKKSRLNTFDLKCFWILLNFYKKFLVEESVFLLYIKQFFVV